MDNQKQKKKKSVMDTLSATMVLVLIALLLVFVGYTYLALKNGYTLDDLIDNIVGNLIGVLAAFLLFDISLKLFQQYLNILSMHFKRYKYTLSCFA